MHLDLLRHRIRQNKANCVRLITHQEISISSKDKERKDVGQSRAWRIKKGGKDSGNGVSRETGEEH